MALECSREEEVLAALSRGQEPEWMPDGIEEHLAACTSCANLAALVLALRKKQGRLEEDAPVPEPGILWRRLQRRAWNEAAAAAGQPITAVQVLAFAGAAGVAGACFGATSPWFQAMLGKTAAWFWAGFRAAPAWAGPLPWLWIALAGIVAAAFLLAPVVAYFVLRQEES